MRNRRGLNRIGMLAIALLIALGATGVAYGAWIDEITITGTLSTSDINTSLECGTCSETAAGQIVDVDGTSIGCATTADPMQLTITVTNALQNIEVESVLQDVDYYCEFNVSNAVNSFPVQIQSVTLALSDPLYPYDEVETDITFPTPTALNPGDTTTTGGVVHIYLTDVDSVGLTLEYTLTVVVN